MTISENANFHLRRRGYGPPMVKKRPGSPKGQPKPLKRVLDQEFPVRLRKAMERKGVGVPELAKLTPCTRAALLKYLSGNAKTIEALLLFDMTAALEVSPNWLLGREQKLELVSNKEDRPRGSQRTNQVPPLDSDLLLDAMRATDRFLSETNRKGTGVEKLKGALVLYENFIAGGKAEKAAVSRILNLVYSSS